MSVGADNYRRPGGSDSFSREAHGVEEKAVSLRSVVAAALWVAGIVLVLVDAATEHISVGQIGLTGVAGGMVLTMRGCFSSFYRHEHDVFELGRDYERGHGQESPVRSLR